MPLPLARCAFSRSSAGTSTVILRAVSMTPQYTIPGTSIEYGLAGHSQQPPFVRRRSVYHGRKSTLSVHSSASLAAQMSSRSLAGETDVKILRGNDQPWRSEERRVG